MSSRIRSSQATRPQWRRLISARLPRSPLEKRRGGGATGALSISWLASRFQRKLQRSRLLEPTRDPVIAEDHFRVQHARLVFPDLHAIAQQLPVEAPRGMTHPGMVRARTGQQQAHIDAAAHRAPQRGAIAARGHEIGAHDPCPRPGPSIRGSTSLQASSVAGLAQGDAARAPCASAAQTARPGPAAAHSASQVCAKARCQSATTGPAISTMRSTHGPPWPPARTGP